MYCFLVVYVVLGQWHELFMCKSRNKSLTKIINYEKANYRYRCYPGIGISFL